MKNLKLKLKTGQDIELDVCEMSHIKMYYNIQNTADFLRDNYVDWNEDKIQIIAASTRRFMDKYDLSEEEAIDSAIDEYEKRY